MKLIIGLLTLLLISTPTFAGSLHELFINGCQAYVSGVSLQTKPIEKSDQMAIGYCLGLVDGVSKTIYHYNLKDVCFPEEPSPTLDELINVVMVYIHKDPEKVKKLSSMGMFSNNDLIHLAFLEKYPCDEYPPSQK
ncbi:hypothetical protein IB286_15065 [Spongiibacter sp. KMU-158]|uniref:Rap1a immunity protein domain-containing protein n=1 Tax=Spongiibacter pelagi TaxID=2760804 RepID=A0A927GXA3_9GAMM|nr:Rap1a/Tai family immunity protein [Spongiibacter pelagi]MBD2860315.1 hypothetical protein [Spongiibacter pelagi]